MRSLQSRSSRSRRTVRGELARMLRADAIDRATHDAHRRTYAAAQRTRGRLSGTRRVQLAAVLRNLEDVAAGGELTVSRLPSLFETVARNRAWWSEGPLIAGGRRVRFARSQLIWQFYPGQGLQIQWLGTFGRANGLFAIGTKDDELRALLDEALPLAAQRAGGTAFEYLFRFGPGRPPWASALAQGTAMQALSRAAVRLQEPRYFAAARSLLGIFRTPPPAGVRAGSTRRSHYLIYSYDRRLRVLNGFVQALNGLYDFGKFANDDEGRALFAAGERQLRVELGRYDTGAWTRYSRTRDADLGYHTLVRDFLRNLCGRLGEEGATVDPAPYCSAADRFTSYLREAPELRLVSRRVRRGDAATVRFEVSKPSFVRLRLVREGRTVATLAGRVGGGRRSLRWARPGPRGDYRVHLSATDLAGNAGRTTGALEVLRARSPD
jgi:hypothetical protein